ncbi:MAG: helix-turn-helix domain-containing protein [Bacteroidales bacterium]
MNTIYIKNMVCDRCTLVVRDIFEQLNIAINNIRLGEIDILEPLASDQLDALRYSLEEVGFEIIDDRCSKLIEQIKSSIRELVHRNDCDLKVNISDYVANSLKHEYNSLSSLFSQVEGVTIERYYIAQRVERVKELLIYDDLSLSEIAYKLNYSSTAHLSNQFKKFTGLTPTFYKQLADKRRQPIDKI